MKPLSRAHSFLCSNEPALNSIPRYLVTKCRKECWGMEKRGS